MGGGASAGTPARVEPATSHCDDAVRSWFPSGLYMSLYRGLLSGFCVPNIFVVWSVLVGSP